MKSRIYSLINSIKGKVQQMTNDKEKTNEC